MKVVIPGGSGQVGTILARAFHADGHDVVVLSRAPEHAPWRVVAWNAKTVGAWTAELNNCDVVINLAGRSVNCRYSDANKREILASRVDSTRAIGRAIADTANPPSVWLQSSTATIYAHRFDAPNDDISGIIGGNEPDTPESWNFSIDVANEWEKAADEIPLPLTRTVKLRSAMIMSPDRGGIFDQLARLVKLGIGGTASDGRQYLSWIHDADFIRAIRWLIDHDELAGAVNVAAPEPLPNREFMKGLRQACGAPIGLPATKLMLEVGAFFMRSETELILKSRRVVPRRLADSGFDFQFPDWSAAARDLCVRHLTS